MTSRRDRAVRSVPIAPPSGRAPALGSALGAVGADGEERPPGRPREEAVVAEGANGARVLVGGGTGHLGSRVIDELLLRGKAVRALVRPASDATAREAKGVSIARGDMLDPPSLRWAMEDADAVITTAAGYTRHSKGDSPDIDVTGNRNLADA